MFFDIETLPLEKEKHHVLAEIREKMEADGKYVKDFKTMLSETCFDGGLGRIACISYALNDAKPVTLKGDETKILKDFWEVARTVNLFVGFNVFSFDLRFIYQRSMVFKVKSSIDLNFAWYRNYPIYDIMCEWVKWDYNSHVNMDRLARVLGLQTSKGGEVEGKNVAKAFEEGRIDEICEYCEKDVELTRAIYKRMTFEGMEEDIPF